MKLTNNNDEKMYYTKAKYSWERILFHGIKMFEFRWLEFRKTETDCVSHEELKPIRVYCISSIIGHITHLNMYLYLLNCL